MRLLLGKVALLVLVAVSSRYQLLVGFWGKCSLEALPLASQRQKEALSGSVVVELIHVVVFVSVSVSVAMAVLGTVCVLFLLFVHVVLLLLLHVALLLLLTSLEGFRMGTLGGAEGDSGREPILRQLRFLLLLQVMAPEAPVLLFPLGLGLVAALGQ